MSDNCVISTPPPQPSEDVQRLARFNVAELNLLAFTRKNDIPEEIRNDLEFISGAPPDTGWEGWILEHKESLLEVHPKFLPGGDHYRQFFVNESSKKEIYDALMRLIQCVFNAAEDNHQ